MIYLLHAQISEIEFDLITKIKKTCLSQAQLSEIEFNLIVGM